MPSGVADAATAWMAQARRGGLLSRDMAVGEISLPDAWNRAGGRNLQRLGKLRSMTGGTLGENGG